MLLTVSACGCSGVSTWQAPPVPFLWTPAYNNPVTIPSNHPEYVWEQIVDVTDDYFTIMEEVPVREIVGSEGRLETLPVVGATLLEPWRHDSANFEERLECTLQTIRRRAIINVKMVECGYAINVAVYKELEDRPMPDQAVAGSATFSYTSTQIGVIDPITDEPMELGWISLGRDKALEQRMLSQITARLGMVQPQSPTCR
jgi:hypothetical protein